MKKLIFGLSLIIAITSVLILTGCVRRDMSEKNGPFTTQSYDYTGFTGIDIGSSLKLEVTPATSYSVTITAGKKQLDRIHVSQTGDILKITMDGWFSGWWWGSDPKITITMPTLKQLYLSGASEATARGFKSDDDLSVKVSGASELQMDLEAGYFTAEISGASSVKGRLTCPNSDIDISGASDIDLTGSGGDIKLHGSGASTAALSYFAVNNADIEFTSASNGSLDISGRMDVSLSGASSLNYYGNPTLGRTDVTGASDLNHKTRS